MSWFENLSLAVDQKTSGVTGDRTSGWDRVGNTWSSMFGGGENGDPGVLGNMVKSFQDAGQAWSDISKPAGDPPKPPSDAEKSARIARATQQTVDAVMGALSMGQDMLNVGFANLTAPLAAIWPSLPAATLGCFFVGFPHGHTHPPSLVPPAPAPIPLPSFGPILFGTCVQVLINYIPAARCGDLGWSIACGGFFPWFEIKTGSSNVFIGGSRAARMGDICMACAPAGPRGIASGKVMAKVGAIAEKAETALDLAGLVAGGIGVAADIAEASVEDDAAMQDARVLSAAMGAAQLASDIAAMIISNQMGKDPGVPPSIGAVVIGHPNVLIGGFPMVNIPNPVELLLKRLKRHKAKAPKPKRKGEGCDSCEG